MRTRRAAPAAPSAGWEPSSTTRPAARALSDLEMIRRGFYFARRGFMSLSLPLDAGDYDDLVDAFGDFLDEHREVLSD